MIKSNEWWPQGLVHHYITHATHTSWYCKWSSVSPAPSSSLWLSHSCCCCSCCCSCCFICSERSKFSIISRSRRAISNSLSVWWGLVSWVKLCYIGFSYYNNLISFHVIRIQCPYTGLLSYLICSIVAIHSYSIQNSSSLTKYNFKTSAVHISVEMHLQTRKLVALGKTIYINNKYFLSRILYRCTEAHWSYKKLSYIVPLQNLNHVRSKESYCKMAMCCRSNSCNCTRTAPLPPGWWAWPPWSQSGCDLPRAPASASHWGPGEASQLALCTKHHER